VAPPPPLCALCASARKMGFPGFRSPFAPPIRAYPCHPWSKRSRISRGSRFPALSAPAALRDHHFPGLSLCPPCLCGCHIPALSRRSIKGSVLEIDISLWVGSGLGMARKLSVEYAEKGSVNGIVIFRWRRPPAVSGRPASHRLV